VKRGFDLVAARPAVIPAIERVKVLLPAPQPDRQSSFDCHSILNSLIHPDRSINSDTETTMATFENYKNAYANPKMTRSTDGILEVAFHTNEGKLVFNGHTPAQFTDMFHQIGEDYHNRVVILTGSGDAFMDAALEGITAADVAKIRAGT
jgi:hypothetical protein